MKELDAKNISAESVKPLPENIKRRIVDDVDNDEIPGAVAKELKGYINESFSVINEQNKILTERMKAAESSQTNINEIKWCV